LRKELVLAIAISIILFSNCLKTELTNAQTPLGYTLTATDDTHADSTNPNEILGAQKYLDVESWGDASTSYNQIVWLKFSLSDIPDGVEFNQATLQVYAWFTGKGFSVSAYSCSDNSWTESTLTYSNMPEYNATPISTVVVATSEEWQSWNVVDALRSASEQNLDAVTIVLSEPMLSSQNSVFLYSKETPSLVMDVSPKLTLSWSLSTSSTPEPTPKPSSTTGTPTPVPSSTMTTNEPTPTSTLDTPIDWTIWGILLALIGVAVLVTAYMLTKKKRNQLIKIPPPPPP
jgi:hypothetical protein